VTEERLTPLGTPADSLASLDWDMYETDPIRHPLPSHLDITPPSETDDSLMEDMDEVKSVGEWSTFS